ncbi:stimulator of interferon genes protein 2-like [Clytia hemisphaerica]|uniref:Stimulator of interferon genes protein n=1 Tax=Clytia hemisphaerica TaxID=252671 RepID=A0A7M5UCC9_9CNID
MDKSLKVNNFFGELPERRGYGAECGKLAAVVVFLLTLARHRTSNNKEIISLEDLGDIAVIVLAIISAQLLRCLYLLVEERRCLFSRYNGSIQRMLKACLPDSPSTVISIKIGLFLISFAGSSFYWITSTEPRLDFSLFIVITFILSLDVLHLSKAEISHLNETKNQHVADGLAWSYYFGYLKLILPRFPEMINLAHSEDDTFKADGVDLRDQLSSEKLFIIIPKNCYTHAQLGQFDDRICRDGFSTPEFKYTRAGVKERSYKNTAWRIDYPGEESLYVLMEYATPCLSMHDMMLHARSQFDEEDLEAQVKEFSIKLQSILDSDEKCKGRYHLILCGDIRHQKLGDLIKEAVQKEREEQKKGQ